VSGANGSTVTYAAAGSCVIGASQAWQRQLRGRPASHPDHHSQPGARVRGGRPAADRSDPATYDWAFEAAGTPAPTHEPASGARGWPAVIKRTFAISAARQIRDRLNMRPPSLNIYTSQSNTDNARSCRGQGRAPRYGVGPWPCYAVLAAVNSARRGRSLTGSLSRRVTLSLRAPRASSRRSVRPQELRRSLAGVCRSGHMARYLLVRGPASQAGERRQGGMFLPRAAGWRVRQRALR
jgi:hypothetical protein